MNCSILSFSEQICSLSLKRTGGRNFGHTKSQQPNKGRPKNNEKLVSKVVKTYFCNNKNHSKNYFWNKIYVFFKDSVITICDENSLDFELFKLFNIRKHFGLYYLIS